MVSNSWKSLWERIGLNEKTRKAVEEQGIKSLDDLKDLTIKDISTMVTNILRSAPKDEKDGESGEELVVYPFVALKRTCGARYWIDMRIRSGQNYGDRHLNSGELRMAVDRLNELDLIKEYTKNVDPLKPGILKSSGEWQNWVESGTITWLS